MCFWFQPDLINSANLSFWTYLIGAVIQRLYCNQLCEFYLFQGFQILTGSWVAQNSLQLWDYSSGKLIKNIPYPDDGNGEYLYVAQFCENDTVVAGGSGTNNIKAINIHSGEVRSLT